MTKRTRLIILSICVILFLVAAPYIVLYSLGYRIDFDNLTIVGTGGIYVKGEPQALMVSINDATPLKTSYFNNSIFVQNLVPKVHTIKVAKEGYYDYIKNVEVKAKEVTKVEHIVLFQKDISFTALQKPASGMFFSPDETTLLATRLENGAITVEIINTASQQKRTVAISGQRAAIKDVTWSSDSKKALLHTGNNYFLIDVSAQNPAADQLVYLLSAKEVAFNPQNANEIFYLTAKSLYTNLGETPITQNILAFALQGNAIMGFSADGFLYSYTINNQRIAKETQTAFTATSTATWDLLPIAGKLYLQKNNQVFVLNTTAKAFENFYDSATTLKASPDQQKILTCNDHEVLYFFSNQIVKKAILLNRFSEKVIDCFWINNDYVVFSVGNNIMISEIDVRGNINMITLPQNLGEENVLKSPNIHFNPRDEKLYILNQQSLVVSEKLLP